MNSLIYYSFKIKSRPENTEQQSWRFHTTLRFVSTYRPFHYIQSCKLVSYILLYSISWCFYWWVGLLAWWSRIHTHTHTHTTHTHIHTHVNLHSTKACACVCVYVCASILGPRQRSRGARRAASCLATGCPSTTSRGPWGSSTWWSRTPATTAALPRTS